MEDAYVRVTERNAERHKLSGQRAHSTPGVDETVEREIALTVWLSKISHITDLLPAATGGIGRQYHRRAAPLRPRNTIHHFGSLPQAPRKLPPITFSATARLSLRSLRLANLS